MRTIVSIMAVDKATRWQRGGFFLLRVGFITVFKNMVYMLGCATKSQQDILFTTHRLIHLPTISLTF